MTMTATPVQNSYAFYRDDGGEAAATIIGAADTQQVLATGNAGSGVFNFHLRIGIYNNGTNAGASTDDWQLQYQINAGGWTNITAATPIRGRVSSNLTDAAATTQRLASVSGKTWGAGEISNNTSGLVTDYALAASGFTELLYSLQAVTSALAENDTVEFRVLRNGAIITSYLIYPTLSISLADYLLLADPLIEQFVWSADDVETPLLNATPIDISVALPDAWLIGPDASERSCAAVL
jgi:hypothetical protein